MGRIVIATGLFVVSSFAVILFFGVNPNIGMPKSIKLLSQGVLRPKDLYSELVRGEIDISHKGDKKIFTFKNKYAGKHDVGLLLENFRDDLYFDQNTRTAIELKMEINFLVDGKSIMTRQISGGYSPFMGRTGSGFSAMHYIVPDELPINEPISCVVQIVEPDAHLNKYAPAHFSIRKISDK